MSNSNDDLATGLLRTDAVLYSDDGVLDSCGTLDVDADGRISALYLIRNPDKLQAVARALGHVFADDIVDGA